MKNYILSQEVAEKKLRRMAYEILENNSDEKQLILAGIRDNGTVIARTIQNMLSGISGSLSTRLISISLDKRNPGPVTLSETLPFDDQVIIVIDDVAMSGKTLLYAMRPFLDYHPRKIESLVLVERTHKTFPVQPDYTGLSLSTTLQEHIYVEVDGDLVKGAWLE